MNKSTVKLSAALMLLAVLASGCSSNNAKLDVSSLIDQALIKTQSPIVFEAEPAPVLVSVKSPKDARLEKMVNATIKSPINIVAAIDFADSSLSVSGDAGVDLNKKFIVNFKNQTLKNYFEYLSNVSGYSLTLKDSIVYVKSIDSKTWNLATLSLNTSQDQTSSSSEIGTDGNNGSSGVALVDDNNWQDIVKHVTTIMNSGSSVVNSASNEAKDSTQKAPVVVVTDNQQLGTISVIGLPNKIKQVDEWLSYLIDSSNRQVHMQVQVLDITVDESVGQGINWNLISKQSSQFQIGNDAKQVIDGAGIISIGTPAGAVIDLGKKITLDVMLNLLRKQGKVRVDNQPNVTVTNGREAYITTGDQFSYVSSIDSTPDTNGNVVTTSEVERMSVGVDMRVTPKILPDNRIVVSIVPVVSSLKSYTTLTSGSGSSLQEFKTPNIALQRLTTQVIVESGKTIHLGGLIASKVVNAAKGLPSGGVMDVFFKGVQKSLERREIVILVTPTIVR